MLEDQTHNAKETLLLIKQGNADAFSEIYALYKDKIFAFAFALTKSRDIAEEIVQEVFFKLWDKREQINIEYPFTAYVKKITYHHIISYFRKVKLDRKLQEKLYSNLQVLTNSQDDELVGKELYRLYQQAIEQLAPQKKKLYLLSREEHFNYEEIAEKMGISKNTVRNHMTEAIQFIRKYISDRSNLHFFLLVFLIKSTEISNF